MYRESGARIQITIDHLVEDRYKALWATPTAGDAKSDRNSEGYTSLAEQVREAALWPTPMARDWKGPSGRALKGEVMDLPGQVALWATPRVGGDGGTAEHCDLSGQVEEAIGTEPATSDAPTEGKTAATGTGESLRLNPEFSLWMQGFPKGWLG
jgi:hypothetical protein